MFLIHIFIPRENKAFRQTLVDNIPGIEPVLKVLLQEEGNALQEVSKSVSNTTQKVVDVKDTVFGFFGGSKEEEKTVPSKCEQLHLVEVIRLIVFSLSFSERKVGLTAALGASRILTNTHRKEYTTIVCSAAFAYLNGPISTEVIYRESKTCANTSCCSNCIRNTREASTAKAIS